MRKIVLILVALLMLGSLALVGASCDDDDEVVTWKLATYSLPGTFQTEALQDFADLVEEKTDGRMEIKVDTSLYTFSEILPAVSNGVVEMGLTSGAFVTNQMPILFGVTTYAIPTLTDTAELVELLWLLNEGVPGMKQEEEDNDVRSIMWISSGSSDYYSKDLATKIEDLDGLKIGCAPGAFSLVSQLGGSPVEMDMMEIYQNAQQGVIDAFLFASTEELYLQGQLYSVLPCITVIHMIGWSVIMTHQPSFEALPEDLQNAVLDAASETQAKAVDDYDVSWSNTLQTLEDNPDIDVYVLSETERAEWMDSAILPIMRGIMEYYTPADDVAKADEIVDSFLD